ncbi:MAG: hypothetical protein NC301_00840 [Bacteroides sp.]|nr:hypothetical protein [Bacteroides sp.]MCM1378842.1 hypothetical protein [Bacteroides sp.]MCM1445459.1 hypothetical protein [Prevotella sp.]
MKAKILSLIIAAGLCAAPNAPAAKKKTVKFTPEELMVQATEAFYNYDVDLAREKIADLRANKKHDRNFADSLEARVNRLDEMIQRVEDVAIIDSLNVPRADFFEYYRLSPTSGTLVPPSELGYSFRAADETAVYIPEDGTFMIWGGENGLVQTNRLTDGTWEPAVELGDVLNAGGTANYPFLMPDGTTLYYATDGDDSLGGLDLYISVRNRDGFALPQNMGMPYNSPYDDYMLAIDEFTGAGWFATDRNQLGDSVTIYVFVPSESRVNIDVDADDLAERAQIASLTAPLTPSQEALLKKIRKISRRTEIVDNTPDFIFPLTDGRVYTRWSDFRSDRARRLMENYVDALEEFDSDTQRLNELRRTYRPGNQKKDDQILAFEKKLLKSRETLLKLSNQVIEEELK